MRVIGLDVHRTFAQVAVLEDGLVKDKGRVTTDREAVLRFGNTLSKEDDVVIEATGNTAVIVRLLAPFVRRVAIANPLQVRAIAWAKVKTDKIDAATLARLHAAQFLPEVWMPTEQVELQRRCVAERTQLVSQMTRLKNRIQSILHANLIPPQSGRIYGKGGRLLLEQLPLPGDQMRTVLRHHGEIARLASELAVIEKDLAARALTDPAVKRLMTIGGVNAVVAWSVLAAIGDMHRFSSPEKLVSYLGLNPSVHHWRLARETTLGQWKAQNETTAPQALSPCQKHPCQFRSARLGNIDSAPSNARACIRWRPRDRTSWTFCEQSHAATAGAPRAAVLREFDALPGAVPVFDPGYPLRSCTAHRCVRAPPARWPV